MLDFFFFSWAHVVSSLVFIKFSACRRIPEHIAAPCGVSDAATGSLCLSVSRLHMAAAVLHRRDAARKLLPPRNRCPWACFLCSLAAESLCTYGRLPPQSGTATCCSTFFFPRHGLLFFLTLQNTFSFFLFLFCLDIHGVFNRALPKRENVYLMTSQWKGPGAQHR